MFCCCIFVFIRYTNLLISTKPFAFIPPGYSKQLWGNQTPNKTYFHHQKSRKGHHYREPHMNHLPWLAQFHQLGKCRQCQSPGQHKQTKKSHKIIKRTGLKNMPNTSKGTKNLPIPELVEAVQPTNLSLIITDIKIRRLASLKKDKFEELLKAAGIPARYFCRHSFATWDILLPSQELATKLARNSSITTKHYRLQPEYMGRRRIKVTVTCPSN